MAARALIAAGLLAALVVALLAAWFVAGSSDADRRAAELRGAPEAAAARVAREAATAVHDELDELLARELARPYYHYQNLFHDPRASAGTSVTPSPLATGPGDPLVRGYFQIDSSAHVTTPRINDEFPALSDRERLAQSRAFRDAVARDLAKPLEPEKIAIAVASAEVRPRIGAPKGPAHPPGAGSGSGSAVVVEVDPNTYAQNHYANAVYGNNYVVVGEGAVAIDAGVDDDAAGGEAPVIDAGAVEHVAPPLPPQPPRPTPRPAPPVTIVISALAWQTLPLGGEPALIAVRRVQTPDGAFAQGFVVDRAALVAKRPGVSLDSAPADDPALEVAPGWQVRAAGSPADVAAASVAADDIEHTFRVRFVAVALAAVLAASLIVVVVARAERLARERSQFAAAAAHELRTPLAGLQLYGDMLADGLGDPTKLRDYARRMSEEASRLGRVVSNVLGFSQLERGNLSVEATPGALDAALRELAERVEPALDRAGVVLELDVADGLRARFDRDALARIIGNLLDNAEKYSRGADDRTLQLTATEVDGAVELVVRDHGDGVAEPARLFRAFARGVTADGPAGLGLGLALSRSLARAMGGELSFRAPTDGPGAAFVLRLAAV